ncbi:MAG: DUF1571 domain-containing protein [Bdellovibrio sp.]|nr:DUF1571 domain-containing protein [Bdellovibrio sp.]
MKITGPLKASAVVVLLGGFFVLSTSLAKPASKYAVIPVSAESSEKRPAARKLLEMLQGRTQKLTDYSAIHFQRERFGNTMGPLMKMRIKYSKGRTYLKILQGPKQDAELLFNPTTGRVTAHKGSFPDLTVHVSPQNHLLLDLQHHTIEDSSFRAIVQMITDEVKNCEDLPGSSIRYLSDRETQTGKTYAVELTGPWVESKVSILKDEDIWAFSKRNKMSAAAILHANGLTDFGDFPSQGEVILPRCYGTRLVVGVDPVRVLPTSIEIFDKKGQLFESYRWEDVDLSPLSDVDFDQTNPAYNF